MLSCSGFSDDVETLVVENHTRKHILVSTFPKYKKILLRYFNNRENLETYSLYQLIE